MNTIKIYLAESGRVATLDKNFPLFQGQFQNTLLNVYVPTSILAPSFTSQNQDGVVLADYVASTAVKIGMSYTARNGTIKVSKNYYMRYLKTLTKDGVEFALYERKLPKEFTLFAGQDSNAPVLIANVVNIQQENEDETPIILSITTSQMVRLDVMPSSSLDNDEAIEPTELENINAQLNEINEILPTKQDKVDEAINIVQDPSEKSVVGSLNKISGYVKSNTDNIETNRQNISKNRNDIDFIIENMQMSEDYIGQLTGTSLPTNMTLNNFVAEKESRSPKNGDVVIFVLEIPDGTDKNYKYFYTASGWQGYEIPPLEKASNGTLGIIQGTYIDNANDDTLVNISGGKIIAIYIKDNTNTYRDIKEYLNSNKLTIDNIISGTTQVGVSLKAIQDRLGNDIINTYLTKELGATKQYVRDYAMPREFNDVYFIATAGYLEQVPTTPQTGIQFVTLTDSVGDFQIFQIQKENTADFELSSKNGYSNNIYIAASRDCKVTFRLTTQYRKVGQDWADLNVELTSPINLTTGDIQKITFNSPFTSLGESVISLTNGDFIRQTLEVVTQTSSPITFNVYSNDIYPSIFNLTSQSYVLADIEQNISTIIKLGADGIIEANRVVFTIQDAESFVEFKTNQREFLINGILPLVGELDDTLPVYIEFGDTVYGVFSYMKGSNTPITIGDLKSNMIYNQAIGYSFTTRMIFLQTSDYVGFALSPMSITAQQLENIINDSETVVVSLDDSGTKLELQLSANILNKIMRALITPTNAPNAVELVAIDENNSQIMLELGEGLYVADGQIKVLGGGGGSGTTNYPDLDNKPILNTNNSTSQTPSANETINGTINLHKISKTGTLADTIQDSEHRTVTDAEKQSWNNKSNFDGSFNSLSNVPTASTGVAGIIQIATDQEAENGTNQTKAVNPKQLKTAIEGLGSVFNLKGSVQNVSNLPSTGNEIGDVYYVVSENVGYIWLNDGTTDRWEQLGLPIDLSGYVQFTDIINALNSTASDKPLSALQGKVLNDMINTLMGELSDTQQDVADNMADIGVLQGQIQSILSTKQNNIVFTTQQALEDTTNLQPDTYYATDEEDDEEDLSIEKANIDASNLTEANVESWREKLNVAKTENVELLYDRNSNDPSINLGYTSGILGSNIINIDLTKYKYLRVYISAYTECVCAILDLTNRTFYRQDQNYVYGTVGLGTTEAYKATTYVHVVVNENKTQLKIAASGYFNGTSNFDRTGNEGYNINKIEGVY